MHIFQWYAVNMPRKCHGWFVLSVLLSREDIVFCGIVFCSDGCRNGRAPCTHWYWQRQERSAFCPRSEKWWRLWEALFQQGFLSQSCTCLSKAVPAAHGSLPFTCGGLCLVLWSLLWNTSYANSDRVISRVLHVWYLKVNAFSLR